MKKYSICFVSTSLALYSTITFADPIIENELIELDSLLVVGEQKPYFEKSRETALKLDKDDLLTPFTTNVINSTVLEDLKATSLEDAYPYISGFSRSGTTANSFTIRGHSADLQNIQVNGLPGSTSRFGSPVTANIDRVEVLKGPASVLYGWMDPAGLVNIITKKPEYEAKNTIDVKGQYFTDQGEAGGEISLDLTGPVNDSGTVLYRLIAGTEKENSFRNYVEEESIYFFPSVSWLPNQDTRLDAQFEYFKDDRSADNGLFVLNHDIKTAADIETYYQEPGGTDNDEGYAINLELNHTINKNLESEFKWRSVWHEDERKLYESNSVQSDDTLRRRKRHQYNEREYHFFDANLTYSPETAIEQTILVGLNGGYEYRQYDRLAFGDRGANIGINPVYTGDVLTNIPSWSHYWDFYNVGLYISDYIQLTDQLSFLVGARQDRQSGDYKSIEAGKADVNEDATVNESTFNLGIVYAINNNVSLYSSLAESFNPQAIPNFDLNGDQLAAETGKQIEIGTKLNLLNDNLNINLAYFDTDKENVAETNSNGDKELVGQISSSGVELNAQYLPTPNLQIQFAYTYTDAEVSKTFNLDVLGNEAAFAPEHNASLWMRYNYPERVLNGTVGASLGLKYESEKYTSSNETKRVELPSYRTVDIGMYYEITDIRLALNVINLLNEEYYIGGKDDYRIYVGDPRKVTLSASYDF